jgi:glutamyl-tRNA synthetase
MQPLSIIMERVDSAVRSEVRWWDFSDIIQNMQNDEKIVTRFAPSPTGFMHVGGVRTALYAWFLARKNHGTFILRIEDTDQKREVEGSMEHIMKSLKWLGLNWDEGPDVSGPNAPYIQSERLKQTDIYKQYAEKLIEKGFAYADTKSEDELDILRKKAEEEKKPFLYREHRPENSPKWELGKPLRFKVQELKRTVWNDLVRGELSAGPEALDDFILIKSDGFPTYNFAHIVDDIEMGVTHVVRGQEFISSTPNYIAVYNALEVKEPFYVTTPPIMGADGKRKLGKRDGAKDILDYEQEGYLPETMINFLAFLGFNPGGEKEIYSKEELAKVFDLNKVQNSGAKWNDEKLDWMNKEHMKLLPTEIRNKTMLDWLKKNPEITKYEKINNENFMSKIYPIIFDRISKWSEIENLINNGELNYYFEQLKLEKSKITWKNQTRENAKENLEKVLEIFENKKEIEKCKTEIMKYAEEKGKGDVLWPLRYTLSGQEKSPDPFTLIDILGINESKERIQNAIQIL